MTLLIIWIAWWITCFTLGGVIANYIDPITNLLLARIALALWVAFTVGTCLAILQWRKLTD
jgi:hypothetical protein